MKTKLLIFLLALSIAGNTQTITGPEQDCSGAIYVDQQIYIQNDSYSGIGNINDLNAGSICLQNDENNSVWYTFGIILGGVLEFDIAPVSTDDYDFALYNLTNSGCSGIPTGQTPEVRCNYAFTIGPTGLRTGDTAIAQGPGGMAFLAPLVVSSGQAFALIVDNFSSSAAGYTLDFSRSTAILGNPNSRVTSNPHISSGSPCGGGTITLNGGITGGSGHYSFAWTGTIQVDSPNARITTVTIPPTGSYTFTFEVIDNWLGDTVSKNLDVNSGGVILAVDAGSNTGVGCFGNTTAQLHATITSGNGAGSTFQWSNGYRGATINVVPGTYTVTATDAGRCTQASDNVTVYGRAHISFSVSHENCGAANGAISSIVTGGLGQLHYSWNTGDSVSNISGLAAGTYGLSVRDNSGCYVADSVTVLDSCGVISGNVFRDVNANGILDTNEIGLAGVEVLATGGLRRLSNSMGNFDIIVPGYGNYSVNVNLPVRYHCFSSLYLPDSLTSPVSGSYSVNISSGNSISSGNHFGLATPFISCGEVNGHVFKDLNANGVEDIGDSGYPNFGISVSPIGYAYSNAVGNYQTEVPFNQSVIISSLGSGVIPYYFCSFTSPISQTFPVNPGYYDVTATPATPISYNNDFGFSNSSSTFDAGIYNVAPHISSPCQNFMVFMDWKIFGIRNTDCYLQLHFDSTYVTFVTSNPLPDTVGADFIGWYFTAGSGGNYGCYGMQFYLDCNAPTGTSLSFTGSWSCGSPDACSLNDHLTRTVTAGNILKRTSDSENYMEVYHQNEQEKYEIRYDDSTFSYLIWFSNNTEDTVYNMTVVDTLPPHFQLNSVSYPFSNKAFDFVVKNDNVLVWKFNNIKLPPARDNELRSYGFIQFNAIMKPNLPLGTKFENRAYITFNYGNAEATNEVENLLGPWTGVENLSAGGYLLVYPNPNDGKFQIKSFSQRETDWTVELYNITGSRLFSKSIEKQNHLDLAVDYSELAKGIYFVKVMNSFEDSQVRKVVVR